MEGEAGKLSRRREGHVHTLWVRKSDLLVELKDTQCGKGRETETVRGKMKYQRGPARIAQAPKGHWEDVWWGSYM